jgi:hypothetical protein
VLLALLGVCFALEAAVVAEGADPRHGQPALLQLAAWDEDGPVVGELGVRALDGELQSFSSSGEGTWQLRWVAPSGGETARFEVRLGKERARVELPLVELPQPSLAAPERMDALAGETVELRLGSLSSPEALQVVISEGETELIERDGARILRWTTLAGGDPRVALIGLRDRAVPGAPPVWTSLRLAVRRPVSLDTEPGATLSLVLGARQLGPVRAGADGKVVLQVDVWPGDTSANYQLSDTAGNVQRGTLTLAPRPGPVVLALPEGPIVPGASLPPLHLRAVTGSGRSWAGRPSCSTSGGGELALAGAGEGAWIARLPPVQEQILLDLRVDCALQDGAATTSARVAVREGLPARIVLLAWPQELSTDFPVSQVQATLEDARGDRLSPEGLDLRAVHGRLERVELDELSLRAEYRGKLDQPDDAVVASWNHAPGRGQPSELQIGVTTSEGGLQLQARSLDALGRPLAGQVLSVTVGGGAVELLTDQRGWASAELPRSSRPEVLEVQGGGLRRRVLVLPWVDTSGLDAQAPDLQAQVPLSIRAGRVRSVTMSSDRAVVLTGSDDTATVTIVLLDAAGRPVQDEAVSLSATEGTLSSPRPQADGSLQAIYQPPRGLSAGVVEIAVAGAEASFGSSILVQLAPEPVVRAPSVYAGWLGNLGGISSPILGVDLEQRLPIRAHVNLRLGVQGYRDEAQLLDTSGTIDLRHDLLPLTLSAQRRWSRGLWGTWAGAGVAVTPYRLQTWFEGEAAGTQLGFHLPGATVYGGGGYRVRPGEVYGELRYLAVGSNTEAYEGQLGGLVAILGFRVVY